MTFQKSVPAMVTILVSLVVVGVRKRGDLARDNGIDRLVISLTRAGGRVGAGWGPDSGSRCEMRVELGPLSKKHKIRRAKYDRA